METVVRATLISKSFRETVEEDTPHHHHRETGRKAHDDMGAYLSQPVKEKESSDGGNARVKFGTSAMQGWRTSMEVRPFELAFVSVFCVLAFCVSTLRLRLLVEEVFSKRKQQKPPPLSPPFFSFCFTYYGCLFVVVRRRSFSNTACSHFFASVSSLPPFDASTGFALRGTRLGRGDIFLCRV